MKISLHAICKFSINIAAFSHLKYANNDVKEKKSIGKKLSYLKTINFSWLYLNSWKYHLLKKQDWIWIVYDWIWKVQNFNKALHRCISFIYWKIHVILKSLRLIGQFFFDLNFKVFCLLSRCRFPWSNVDERGGWADVKHPEQEQQLLRGMDPEQRENSCLWYPTTWS